jgi:hypothetical protein
MVNIRAYKRTVRIVKGVPCQAGDGNRVVRQKRSVPISILTLPNLMHPARRKNHRFPSKSRSAQLDVEAFTPRGINLECGNLGEFVLHLAMGTVRG